MTSAQIGADKNNYAMYANKTSNTNDTDEDVFNKYKEDYPKLLNPGMLK